MALVGPVDERGCIPWLGRLDKDEYGAITIRGVRWVASRLCWRLFRGPIPAGKYICHKCDTPRCVNIDHLFVGSPTDNSRDMVSKQRNRFVPRHGTEHGSAKLTEAQVIEIRRLYSESVTPTELAKRFNISRTNARRVATGELWRHVAFSAQATVTASQPVPLAAVAVATNSKSTLNSETRVDDGHWPATADPADPVAVSISDPVSSFPPSPVTSASRSVKEATPLFSSDDPELDAIISALEAEWLRDGIVMKATALRVAVSSLIQASSPASDISIPAFSKA
jgi:hypothetical protein